MMGHDDGKDDITTLRMNGPKFHASYSWEHPWDHDHGHMLPSSNFEDELADSRERNP